MKNILCLLLLILSYSLSAKEFYSTCNSCSSYQMKQKAESIFIQPYGTSYANIFDESDKEYKRYRLSTGFIDDMIQVTMATETSSFSDVQTAFNEYVNAINTAYSSISTIDSLEIKNDGGVSPQSLSVKFSSGISTMSADSEECQAIPVSDGDLTAHDYVSKSQNRRILFNNIKAYLDNRTQNAITAMEYKFASLITTLEGHDNLIVSTASSILGTLDLTSIELEMPDGGFVKGHLNFKSKSFDIEIAVDGDCWDVPLNADEVESRYEMSTSGGADKMIELLEGYGGRLNVPVCQKETKVCTGIHNQTLSCHSICFQWR